MRLAVLGNSGSGKSTLARWASEAFDAPCLDLDTVAWEPGEIAVTRDPVAARADVVAFCRAHDRWVVEGCYASLIGAALPFEPRLILLNPGVEQCLANCRARPWEPHKYGSQEEQDRHLADLLSWVRGYYVRDGDLSLVGHQALLRAFTGRKLELNQQPSLNPPAQDQRDWLA